MTATTKTYFKDLTRKERKHLREQGITTLKEFKVCAAGQAKQRRVQPPEWSEPCWDCRMIAKKLGLPV